VVTVEMAPAGPSATPSCWLQGLRLLCYAMIPTTLAQVRPDSSPHPARATTIPRIRWIQPRWSHRTGRPLRHGRCTVAPAERAVITRLG
jgi:hypothetical protein